MYKIGRVNFCVVVLKLFFSFVRVLGINFKLVFLAIRLRWKVWVVVVFIRYFVCCLVGELMDIVVLDFLEVEYKYRF